MPPSNASNLIRATDPKLLVELLWPGFLTARRGLVIVVRNPGWLQGQSATAIQVSPPMYPCNTPGIRMEPSACW